jgi:nucleoside-diphosphate-sugar epimerase
MKKILITGNKGFVGRHLKQYYASYGTEFTLIDINGGEDARAFFKRNDTQFDMVFHCAALVGGRLFIENAPLSVALDLSIDAEFFNWVIRTRPKAVAYFSSSAAYPIELQTLNSGHKLKETDIDLNNIKNPDYTYGWAKLTGEYLAQFALERGINVKVFRPFSGYGSDQDLAYPFPSFILRGKMQENPFHIWGNGQQVRDWIHIDDIVKAIDEAFKQDIPGPINLGNGRATSFLELADLVQKEAGYSAPVELQSDMPSGVMYRVSDNSKLLSFYTPKITLEEGIARALKAN